MGRGIGESGLTRRSAIARSLAGVRRSSLDDSRAARRAGTARPLLLPQTVTRRFANGVTRRPTDKRASAMDNPISNRRRFRVTVRLTTHANGRWRGYRGEKTRKKALIRQIRRRIAMYSIPKWGFGSSTACFKAGSKEELPEMGAGDASVVVSFSCFVRVYFAGSG